MKKIITLTGILIFILSFSSFAQVPVVTSVSGPTAVCSAPAATTNYNAFATNSPTSYTWTVVPSASVVIGSPNASSTSISFPQSNATFTIYCQASNGMGTSVPKAYVVHVFQTPIVTFSGANSFCQGSSTNISASSTLLSGSSTISYSWSPSAGLSATSGPTVTASPAVTTTYVVTATIGFCSNTSTIAVNVLPVPFITTVASPSVVCAGNMSSNTASGANTYTWSNGVLNGSLFTPTATASYSVIGRAVNGCTNSASSIIYVNPLPAFSVNTNSTTICPGQTATLSFGNVALSYSLNGVACISPSAAISPSMNTTYTITGTTAQGCSTTKTFTQVVVPCAGVEEIAGYSLQNIFAYPNPSLGSFKLRSGSDETVMIVNELGQTIRTVALSAGNEATVSGLTNGIYFVVTHHARIKILVMGN